MTCGTNPFGGPLGSRDESGNHALSLVPEPDDTGSQEAAGTGSAGSGDGSGNRPGTGAGLVLAAALPGREMTWSEQLITLLRLWAKRAAAHFRGIRGPGDIWCWWRDYQPESMAQHRAYLKSRGWIPEGHGDRKLIRAASAAGVVYGVTIGRGGKALGKTLMNLGKAIDGISERPSRALLVVLIAIIAFLLIRFA